MMVKACSGHQFGLCRQFTYRTVFPPTPDLDAWLEACTEELGALRETKTYILVHEDEVDPHNVIRCCWVFTLKKGSDGEVKCYKVCIVTKGFSCHNHLPQIWK